MATHDFTDECAVSAQVPVEELRQRGCAICRNAKCAQAQWAESEWTKRMQRVQEEKIDHPQFADDRHPKYAEFAEQQWERVEPVMPQDWQKSTPAIPSMEGRPMNTPPPPAGGILLSGQPAPVAEEVDPWAPKEKMTPVGAKVQLGGGDDG
jgi:hypothetical protein